MDELLALKLVLSMAGEGVDTAHQYGKITANEADEKKEKLHEASNTLFDLLILREEAEQEKAGLEYGKMQLQKKLLN